MSARDGLLLGMRGRRLCWELIGLASFDLGGIPRARVTEQVSRAVEELGADDPLAGRRLLVALRRSVDAAMYWQEPDECDYYLRDPEFAELLRPVADVVAASPATAWWSGNVPVDGQHYVELLDDGEAFQVPALTGARQALGEWRRSIEESNAGMRELRISSPDLYSPKRGWANVSGHWWSAPIQFPIRSTTRAIPELGPIGMWLVEDSPGFRRAVTWPVRPDPAPRVVELTGPDSWVDLVRRHPIDVSDGRGPDWQHLTGRRGEWLIPNWQALAQEFDAVHLTVQCYLTTAGQVIELEHDAGSVIAGWAPDETYWLTDTLEITGPAAHWIRSDSADDAWHVADEQD